MINAKIIFRVLGSLLLLEMLLLLSCLGVGVFYNETDYLTFGVPALVAALLGGGLHFVGRGGENHMTRRDGYLSVSLSWLTFSIVGALPFLVSGYETRISAAFFETISGFTTTGATALDNIDSLPHSLLFWRSLIHWFGGLGIVFFTLAILPTMGTSGLKLFSAEATGLKIGKLHPRISTTARWLWGVYLFLTVACTLAYHLGGMSVFDAINHAFSTIATGGFSTHQDSFAYFQSARLEMIAAVLMFISGINFTLLYLFFIKRRFKDVLRDGELRFYILLMLGAVVIIAGSLLIQNDYSLEAALRESFFNVTSIQSSTGFTSNDPSLWPAPTLLIIFLLTAFGACAGSTTGGIKCIRVLTSYKLFVNEFRHILHPNAVLPLRINRTTVTVTVSHSVFAFLIAFALLLILGTLVYLFMGLTPLDAFSATLSLLSNAGPAFGHTLGPLDSWAQMSDSGLWLGSFLMLIWRLEIFSLLLPFVPAFWKDN